MITITLYRDLNYLVNSTARRNASWRRLSPRKYNPSRFHGQANPANGWAPRSHVLCLYSQSWDGNSTSTGEIGSHEKDKKNAVHP